MSSPSVSLPRAVDGMACRLAERPGRESPLAVSGILRRGAPLADRLGYTAVVIDDVLYNGNSLLRAVAYLAQKPPQRILVATLADRCVTHLPLHADVVGVRLEVAPGDSVECNVPPDEPTFRIELLQMRQDIPSA